MKNNKSSYLYKIIYNYSKSINEVVGSTRKERKEGRIRINKVRDIYLKENSNKGVRLQRVNKINSWENIIYKYNKNKEIKIWVIDRLVSKLIIKIFKLNINNINKEIYIGKPKIKHTLNKVYINFNYIIGTIINNKKEKNNKYYTSIITDINNILLNNNNKNNKLIKYLNKLYKKEVIIEANKINYHYNDNIILNKMIINNIEKYKGGLLDKYSKVLRTSIPINNNLLIKNKYISNIIKNNYIKNNNINSHLNININIAKVYKSLNINNICNNLLINKYLIGLNILFKGKNLKTAGVSRSTKNKLLLGSLSNKLYGKYTNFIPTINNPNNGLNLKLIINKSYKLNYIPNHHNIITNYKVNKIKTGTFGITTKLNTI